MLNATYDEIVRVDARPTRPGYRIPVLWNFRISLSNLWGPRGNVSPSSPSPQRCIWYMHVL